MLRHIGERRSYSHNVRLAILLSANADFINTAGFLAFSVLTTNVTGHAALLAVYTASADLRSARMVALWLILYLLGAFLSSMYISIAGRNKAFTYSIPMLVIVAILTGVALFGKDYNHSLQETELFAGSLLFGMGMQNALVSIISGFTVRTTHLTGMVTDLGIDLAAVVTSRKHSRPTIRRRINLRLSIILPFLIGGFIGAAAFSKGSFTAFYGPIFILLTALFYDYFRIKVARALKTIQGGKLQQ